MRESGACLRTEHGPGYAIRAGRPASSSGRGPRDYLKFDIELSRLDARRRNVTERQLVNIVRKGISQPGEGIETDGEQVCRQRVSFRQCFFKDGHRWRLLGSANGGRIRRQDIVIATSLSESG